MNVTHRRRSPIAPTLAFGAGAVLLGACSLGEDRAHCVLERFAEPVPDWANAENIRRPLVVQWGNEPVPYVRLNGDPHVVGNGTTGSLELYEDEAFLVVALHDVMRRNSAGAPEGCMLDTFPVAMICEAFTHPTQYPGALLDFAQQDSTRIGSDLPAVESRLHLS